MSPEPLDVLLEKLGSGDLQAAEKLFVAYEPYLRAVVRRHLPRRLRAKFDSLDIVQAVWVDALHGFSESGRRFADADHLRTFLVMVARHRLTDQLRHYHTALEKESPLGAGVLEHVATSRQPRPSEVAQAEELWQKLLALCPPAYHPLLQLKRQGLLLTEIATQTGLHEGSVRRILRKLARQLAIDPETPALAAGDEA